jgi:hypothetical protein
MKIKPPPKKDPMAVKIVPMVNAQQAKYPMLTIKQHVERIVEECRVLGVTAEDTRECPYCQKEGKYNGYCIDHYKMGRMRDLRIKFWDEERRKNV